MINNAYHETILKSLQDMRSVKPVIIVLTLPHRVYAIETIANAIGFKAVFPELTPENIKALKTSSNAVVIDIVAFITRQKDTKIFDILGKNFISQYGVINVCDTALLYGASYLSTLKNILKYQAPLCISNYNVPFNDIYKTIQKSGQSILGFKSSKKSSLLSLSVCDDVIYGSNDNNIKIIGVDNINHSLNCTSILYAVLAAALMSVNNDTNICGLGSSVLLRAASRRAISVTNGPGSYMPVFIDSLFHLKRDYIYQIQIESISNNLNNKKKNTEFSTIPA